MCETGVASRWPLVGGLVQTMIAGNAGFPLLFLKSSLNKWSGGGIGRRAQRSEMWFIATDKSATHAGSIPAPITEEYFGSSPNL